MHPIAFWLELPGGQPLPVGSYGLCLLLAVTVGWRVCARLGRDVAAPGEWFEFCFGALAGGLLGAKLAQFALDLASGSTLTDAALGALTAGGVWLGGVAGVTLASVCFARQRDIEFARLAGVALIGLTFAHAIGRIGCLLAGCCYGLPSEQPWALIYHSPLAAELVGTPLGVPLHPSPLYEASLEIINGSLLCWLYTRGRVRAAVVLWPLLYGAERFALEFLRGDSRGEWLALSTSQWLTLAMVLGAIALLARRPALLRAAPLALAFALPAFAQNSATATLGDAGPSIIAAGATDAVLLDIDLDGDLDGVISYGEQQTSANIWQALPNRILRNDGGVLVEAGSFGNTVSDAIANGDLNGDGYPDLLVAGGYLRSGGAAASHQVWLNDGAGGFVAAAEFFTGATLGRFSVAVADVDGDLDLDLLMEVSSDELEIQINQGGVQGGTEGAFNIGQTISLPGQNQVITDFSAGQLDGQNGIDLYLATAGGDDAIYFSNGSGSFNASAQTIPGSVRQAVALADMNGDGSLDLVLGDGDGVGAQRLAVWFNNGSGQFAFSGQTSEPGDTVTLATADLNNDGAMDVFAGSNGRGQSSAAVWLNDGSGALQQTRQCFAKQRATSGVVLGDVDGDGAIDALVAAEAVIFSGTFTPALGQDGSTVWRNNAQQFLQCCPFEYVPSVTFSLDDLGSFGKSLFNGSLPALSAQLVDLALLYRVRDEQMLPRLDGARLVAHYQRFSNEVVDLMAADIGFHQQGRDAYSVWKEGLSALMEGQGNSAFVSPGMVQALDDFLLELSQRGGSELQQMINAELTALPPLSNLSGLTMTQFTEQTMGPVERLFSDGFEITP